jgi:hypothetical protein
MYRRSTAALIGSMLLFATSQWGSTQAKSCPESAYCYRSATWNCNGAGTNNWRTRVMGTDNQADTSSWIWSGVVVLTC